MIAFIELLIVLSIADASFQRNVLLPIAFGALVGVVVLSALIVFCGRSADRRLSWFRVFCVSVMGLLALILFSGCSGLNEPVTGPTPPVRYDHYEKVLTKPPDPCELFFGDEVYRRSTGEARSGGWTHIVVTYYVIPVQHVTTPTTVNAPAGYELWYVVGAREECGTADGGLAVNGRAFVIWWLTGGGVI